VTPDCPGVLSCTPVPSPMVTGLLPHEQIALGQVVGTVLFGTVMALTLIAVVAITVAMYWAATRD